MSDARAGALQRAPLADGRWTFADGLVRTTTRPSVDATLGIEVTPGDRALGLVSSLASLPKALSEAPAGPEASARLRVHGGDGLGVRIIEARDGDVRARGHVQKPARAPVHGALLFEVESVRAGLEITNGNMHLRPLVSGTWLEDRQP